MLKAVSSITNAIGALNYKGTWNATTNTPTLVSSVGVKGDYYVVSVAGSTSIDGTSNWGIGDWIVYNGSTWQRVEGGADLNGVNLSVSGTTTLSGLTASTALALDASKNVVSVTNTGTGNNVLATSPTLVTPVLGAATATSVLVNGTGGIGYGTGSGGAVTQGSSSGKGTGVTIDKTSGQITMNNATLNSGATIGFTVNCNKIAATDTVQLNVSQNGSYTASNYRTEAYPTNGNFLIYVTNWSGGNLSEAIILNFNIIKGVIA